MKDELARLAELIKSKRSELGLSQSDLARRLGVTQVTVLYWEKERVMPDMNNVSKIASFLNMSTDELWFYLNGGDSTKEQLDVNRILHALDTMKSSDILTIINAGARKLAQAS